MTKVKPQWIRNKSYSAHPTHDATRSLEQRQEKPLIPVSSATKNKLKVFQFVTNVADNRSGRDVAIPRATACDVDKENQQPRESKYEEAPLTKISNPIKQSSQDGNLLQKFLHPATPAGKLALPDLIGMVDVQIAETDVSPDERITWDYKQSQEPMSVSPYNSATRRGKRARSSSPVLSPAQQSFYSARLATPHGSQAAEESLKTPQMQLELDLWDRYGGGLGKSSTRVQHNPTLAHIMYTSSPQSSKNASGSKKDNGLRRSTSCGNQWPKRRRIAVDEEIRRDPFVDVPGLPSKLSMVTELLCKVQEGYALTRSSAPTTLSDSSVERESCQQNENQVESPQNIATTHDSIGADQQPVLVTAVGNICLDKTGRNDSGSSDYGDFDDEVFEPTKNDLRAMTIETVDITLEGQDHNKQSTSLGTESTTKETTNRLGVPSIAEQDENDDDYGDVDDDTFNDIAQMCDITSSPRLATTVDSRASTGDDAGLNAQMRMQEAVYESDDEYGNEINDEDFEIAEATATQGMHTSDSKSPDSFEKARAIQRYLVTNILDSEYEGAKGRRKSEKLLLVEVENAKTCRSIRLRDGWRDTPVTVKAFVHVIGTFRNNQIIIDDLENMIILHPDHLLSSTVVADSFSCTRRAVLQDRVKATSESTAPLVYGTILHEIFQAAMMANQWDTAWLNQTIMVITKRHLEDLYTIKLHLPQAVEHLRSKIGEMQAWAELFVSLKPQAGAVVKAGNGDSASMCINKLLDVEEHVWSPMYGLKGNIDATVQVTMQDGNEERTLTVPFEVKTGKNANASHRAQTALYSLLLSDRYDVEIAYGVLYYMETSETYRIPGIRHELRHMIMQRNELACYVRERHAQLPPMLKKESLCNRCYAKVPCFIYHRLADGGDGETSGMKAKFDEVVRHLTSNHKEFFLKWDDLLTKEEKESLKFRRELWTMLSREREKLGRCFANVIIEPGSAVEEQDSPKINRYRYTLIKQESSPSFSFIESQITVGEPIVISDEDGHFALANGYVTHVSRRRITVAVDRRLRNARIRQAGFNEVNNQVFTSIMDVAAENGVLREDTSKAVAVPKLYRLDKDEFSNGMATVRNNLIQLMTDGPFRSRELRSLVVDLAPPEFKPHSTNYVLKDRASINVDQRRAIEKVMSAQDYALVLGMPGTGKTTTIAHIIRALVGQNKSVLLTSYTHTAVDNILLKLRDDNIPILRIGSTAKINSEVQEFATLASQPKDTFEDIHSAWHDAPIVATTCLSINHALFNERTFDYCIVDEASQITLPVCLGPIRLARTFVLVGDHNQLPPLVQNDDARKGGLDISLFKHLSDMHPISVVNLEHQYRMCEDVMALSNNLIYSGRLKCGTREVANRSIVIPDMGGLQARHFSHTSLPSTSKSFCSGSSSGTCWLRELIEPSTKVRFIDTDPLLPMSREEAKGNRIVNPTEARLVTQLVEGLLSVGVPASSIGVMTHYRSQLALLKHSLRSYNDVEMHTADRFQGRDKEVVILSLVRSNEARSIGELLKDWRRINVAFTRAKTKLLVVGSRETLKGNDSDEMMAKFVRLMEERRWIFSLPKDAPELHLFDDNATQVTGSAASRSNASGDAGASDKRQELKHHSGKENIRLNAKSPKRARIGDKALLAGKPVLRDIMNDLTGNDGVQGM